MDFSHVIDKLLDPAVLVVVLPFLAAALHLNIPGFTRAPKDGP